MIPNLFLIFDAFTHDKYGAAVEKMMLTYTRNRILFSHPAEICKQSSYLLYDYGLYRTANVTESLPTDQMRALWKRTYVLITLYFIYPGVTLATVNTEMCIWHTLIFFVVVFS